MLTWPKIQRIVFATDLLGSSRLALDYAVAFRSRCGSRHAGMAALYGAIETGLFQNGT